MAITNARMQQKRGEEVNFDPDKMLPGEWAVSLDTKYVRMCFSPGVCVRMATYEAFEADMVKIQKILEECQTIEEAVKQIQLEIDAKEIAIEKYVQEAKAYSETASDEADRATLEADRAKTEADRASSIANIGIATTEKAGIVKPDGETIRVDADGTIHADNGTVDYNELENKPKINDVELSGSKSLSDLGIASADDLEETNSKVNIIIEKAELNIKNSAKGENLHLTDSANSKAVAFGLYGKAEQKQYSGKNLLPNMATSQTINGITFIVNEDGSVSCSGTATAMAELTLSSTLNITGEYILSGCPSGGGNKTYRLFVKTDGTTYFNNDGGEIKITPTSYIDYARIQISSGQTVSNLVFYPMICLATNTDSTYEPYVGGIPSPNPDYPQEITVSGSDGSVEVVSENEDLTQSTNAIIPTPDGLAGIPVESGGNYTDENGQQWICDEIVKYADGSGKRIQRIGKAVLNGTEGVYKIASSGNGIAVNNANTSIFPNIKYGSNKDVPMISNIRKWENDSAWTVGSFGVEYNIFWFEDTGNVLFSTIDDWNNYLATTNMHVLYPLAEPIIADLTAEEIAEIEKLHTFYPITNISNYADCGMSITYLCDVKNYIDNRLAQIESAMINNI